ncbi:MAG TPA: carbohydrate kinase [Sumerlaeia bacterium]|nr:carbohydrate kinase [Sumerlaeia bacterium]
MTTGVGGETKGGRATVVGLGEVLWDLLPEGREIGGAPANFAFHAKQLGADAFIVSCVGEDPLGQEIADRLTACGLDLTRLVIDSNHPTGTVSVDLDPRGKPTFTIHENVAWDFIPWTSDLEELAGRADAVCFGSLAQRSTTSRETVHRFLRATRSRSLRVLDVNLRQDYFDEPTIEASLDLANVLKLNDEELPVLSRLLDITSAESGFTDPACLLEQFMERFSLDAVALTKGAEGCVLATPTDRASHPGFRPPAIVDTVGAGDAFTAALVMGLLANAPLEGICENANRLASHVCSRKGAMAPHP